MPTAGSDYDIVLNSVGYMLDRPVDERGQPQPPRFFEGRSGSVRPTPLASRRVAIADDPKDEYILAEIPDLTGGSGQFSYDPTEPDRYAYSNGIWTLTPGAASLASTLHVVSFGVQDGTASEVGRGSASTPWTVSGSGTITATALVADADADDGLWFWRIANLTSTSVVYQSLANPTVFQGLKCRFKGGYKRAAGTVTARVFVWDDVTGYTYTNLTTTAAWAGFDVAVTVNAAATEVRVGFASDGAGTLTAMSVDSLTVMGEGATPASVTGALFATVLGTSLYAAMGSTVYLWNETNDVFDVVKIENAFTATGIETFGANVYVAGGAGDAFIYGSSTTWTTSNRSGTDDEANFLTRSMDRVGNPVLVRGLKPNTVSISSNPVNGGVAWTNFTVGESDSDLTGVYGWEGTIVAGKEDGLYVWRANTFVNATIEFDDAPNATNFADAVAWGGALYGIGPRGSLWRLSPSGLEGPLPSKTRRVADAPNLVKNARALGTDGYNLLVVTGYSPSAILVSPDGETYHTLYIMAALDLRSYTGASQGSIWGVHGAKIYGAEVAEATEVITFSDYVYVLGRSASTAGGFFAARYKLSSTLEPPAREGLDVVTNQQAYLRLPRVDGGFPLEPKSLTAIEMLNRSYDTNTTTVYYRAGTDDTWTAAGTMTAANPMVRAFSNVSARYFDIILQVNAGDTLGTPFAFGPIIIKGTLRPTRKRAYTMFLRIGEYPNLAGTVDDVGTVQYSNLRTAELLTNPSTLSFVENFEEGGDVTSVSVHVSGVELDRMESSPEGGYNRVYRVDVVEA